MSKPEYPTVSRSFRYTSVEEVVRDMLATRIGNGEDVSTVVTEIAATEFTQWGLASLGYVAGGYNGTHSDDWYLDDNYASYAYLNIHKPGYHYTGQMSVLLDDDMSEPSHWVNVMNGSTSPERRDLQGRWTADLNVESRYVPGTLVWTASFADKNEFITALKTAHALMHDLEALAVQAALLGTTSQPEATAA